MTSLVCSPRHNPWPGDPSRARICQHCRNAEVHIQGASGGHAPLFNASGTASVAMVCLNMTNKLCVLVLFSVVVNTCWCCRCQLCTALQQRPSRTMISSATGSKPVKTNLLHKRVWPCNVRNRSLLAQDQCRLAGVLLGSQAKLTRATVLGT
jgi:hypothetical protein